MTKFKVNIINSIVSEELDGKLYDELIPEEDASDDDDDYIDMIGSEDLEGHPISISYLEEIINKIKILGGNYVFISYHGDHREFIFDVLRINVATEEDIRINNEEKKKYNEKQKKLKALYLEIEKLKRS
jgi:hypothetical protein